MVIQIFVTIIIISIIFPNIYSSFKKQNITKFGAILWFSFWAASLTLIWFPNFIGKIGAFFGVARSIDALIYIAIISLLYTTFRQRVKINEIEKQITGISRKISLKDIKDGQK